MRSTTLDKETEIAEFAVKAASHFGLNPKHSSFGEIGERAQARARETTERKFWEARGVETR